MRFIWQLVAYAAFCAPLAVLSVRPEHRLLGDEEAIISLSFSHAGKRVGECTRLSQEDLMALPPNMRIADECPRERHPLRIELVMDEHTLYKATIPPSGLWADGKSTVYQRIRVPAGVHDLGVRINDSGMPGEIDFEGSANVLVQPGENLVVYFDADSQSFYFHQGQP